MHSREEVARLVATVDPEYHVIACVLYGAGRRLGECLALPVTDLDFYRGVFVVRDGKGGRDRVVMVPAPTSPRSSPIAIGTSHSWQRKSLVCGQSRCRDVRRGS